jgi:hypothetical protein
VGLLKKLRRATTPVGGPGNVPEVVGFVTLTRR